MSDDCPFCSGNKPTAVRAITVNVDEADPIATAKRLFDGLSPALSGLAAVYDGRERMVFWDSALGHVAALIVTSVGPQFADSLMTHAAVMVKAHAASESHGRTN